MKSQFFNKRFDWQRWS